MKLPALAALTALILALPPAAAQEAKKHPVPDKSAQKKALRDVKKEFRDDYRGRDPVSKLALAVKLLNKGYETSGDPVKQYVLFDEALQNAADAGDLETTFRVLRQLDEYFAVDLVAMKLDSLEAVRRGTRGAEESGQLTLVFVELSDEALETDDCDTALKALDTAKTLARKARNDATEALIEKRHERALAHKSTLDQLEKARKKAESDPADVEANTFAGEYLCLARGDWKAGLPYLANATDAALKELAKNDLAAKADDPAACLAMADAWWKWAEPKPDLVKENARGRAAHWYEKAAGNIADKNRNKEVEKLLLDFHMGRLLDGEWIDVTDPEKFGLKGEAGKPIRITIPRGDVWGARLSKFKGDWDGFSAKVTPDQKCHTALTWGDYNYIAYTQEDKVHFTVAHLRYHPRSWVKDLEVKIRKKKSYYITVLLSRGSYIIYLDGREMHRMRTVARTLQEVSLQVSHGPGDFSEIKVRKKQ